MTKGTRARLHTADVATALRAFAHQPRELRPPPRRHPGIEDSADLPGRTGQPHQAPRVAGDACCRSRCPSRACRELPRRSPRPRRTLDARLEYRALVQFFKWALRRTRSTGPDEKMKPPSIPDAPVPIVPPAEFKRLLRTADGKDFTSRRDLGVLLMLYDTGIRAGELVGLTLDDVDLRARLATVTGKAGHVEPSGSARRRPSALDRYLRLRRGHRFAELEWFWLGQRGRLEYGAWP